jgi:outer membrane murein-binding lipoprotein Lpp
MKRMLLAAGIAACLAFAGCSTAQQAQVAAVATNINAQVAKACGVYQPVATDAQALYQLNPDVDLVIDGLNGLCAANATINPSTVQTLAKTTIPAAIKALATTAGISPALAQEIGGALTVANVALNIAVQTYVTTPATPAAASAPAAASQ